MGKKTNITVDVECYSNYFYALFKSFDGTKYELRMLDDEIQLGSRKGVEQILTNRRMITFNGDAYDIVMLNAFLNEQYTNALLKELSDKLILSNSPHWMWLRDHRPAVRRRAMVEHLDLIGPTPLQASLKTYMCRLHAPTIKDLPIDPAATITVDDLEDMETYCENDVNGTELIARHLAPQIRLRGQMGNTYGIGMISKSDPQIAEAIIRHELQEAGVEVSRRDEAIEPFRYVAPQWLQFNDPTLQAVLELAQAVDMEVKESTGHVQLPKALEEVIEYGGAKYKMGIGGLHSQEKKQMVVPGDDEIYGEFDVASMYPSIILEQSLYPKHLTEKFCDVYKTMFDTRMEAKRSGDKVTADTLKIVLNSSYGKFGSKYSFLYSPELLIQTTLTGQLALLMLIERFTEAGWSVKSANTDGVNVLLPRDQFCEAQAIADQWTAETTYVLEWNEYLAQYSRDVNSYIAVYDGGVKSKGAYEMDSIRKGYAHLACTKAVIATLVDGTGIEAEIEHNNTVTDYLIMRGVRGGAVWRGEELGKVVRWYVSAGGEEITYKTNGNKVAGSDGAVPMMTLQESLPEDIDKQWYIAKAYKMLSELGVPVEPEKLPAKKTKAKKRETNPLPSQQCQCKPAQISATHDKLPPPTGTRRKGFFPTKNGP